MRAPRYLSAPTEIEILTEQGDEWVESTQRREKVGAHQRDAAGRERTRRARGPADRDRSRQKRRAHERRQNGHWSDRRAEHERVLVGDDFWCNDAGVRTIGRLDHQLHGVWLEQYVVVTEEEKADPSTIRAASLQAAPNPRFSSSRRTKALGATAATRSGTCSASRSPRRAGSAPHNSEPPGSRRSLEARPTTSGNDDGNNGRSTRVHQ